ncbi:putative lipase atg15, partial [Dinochytrium kinnereticum]
MVVFNAALLALTVVVSVTPTAATSTNTDKPPLTTPISATSSSNNSNNSNTDRNQRGSSTLSLRHIFRIGHIPHSPLTSHPYTPERTYFERTDFHPDPTHPTNLNTTWSPDPDLIHALPTSFLQEAVGVRHKREAAKRLKLLQESMVLPSPSFFDHTEVSYKVDAVPLWSGFSERAKWVRKMKGVGVKGLSGEEKESLEWWSEVYDGPAGRRGGVVSKEDESFSALDNDGEMVTVAHKSYVVPDDRSRDTVLALGKMAYNAYYEPTNREWVEVPGWGASDGFGTKGSGIRGYIYASESQDVVVIVIKGTSLQTPVTGGPSSANDKLNDNKMFSCCCGKAGWSWTPVCGCANRAATSCDVECVRRESDFKESYYRLATSIAHTVQLLFPASSIWMSGHSLGGALASLVALTFDLPALTYETPGDLLFAKRLGLLPSLPPTSPTTQSPFSKSKQMVMMSEEVGDEEKADGDLTEFVPFLNTLMIYQFGNDGDPIFLGECLKGSAGGCWYGGYALETRCHIGKECLYEQDQDGKTSPPQRLQRQSQRIGITKSSSIYNHGIQYVIDRYLNSWEYVPTCSVNGKE